MKLKHILTAMLVLTLIAIGAFLVNSIQSKPESIGPAKVASVAPDKLPAVATTAAASAAPELVPPVLQAVPEPLNTNLVSGVSLTKSGKPIHEKPPIQDPDARAALSLVGTDPEAEQYWMAAINDPALPAEERKDLIEDLNEDGLSDPKHPGQQDVPLIVSRIQLIEELAPDSMDPVNANAFAEAYKDLNNMLAGEPVK
jgi:hypothetical protein